MMKPLSLIALALLWTSTAAAQLVEPNQVGVRMGHVHLAVRDVDAQKQL
jgi:catechol-2,3-dioxygenase